MTVTEAAEQRVDYSEFTLLCVDDEPNILTALRRLFERQGFQVVLADGAEAALALLEREPIDLIISDMRMPGMDGASFLAHASERWPDTPRILLTGYADLASTVDAVNRAGIYGYVSKPWQETDLTLLVRRALELRVLQRQRDQLAALTQRQNDELRTLNDQLEAKVRQRTAELEQTVQMFELSGHGQAAGPEVWLDVCLRVLTQLGLDDVARRGAEVAAELAAALGLAEDDIEQARRGAMLYPLGRLGAPATADSPTPIGERCGERAAALLAGIDSLAGACQGLRYCHERYAGAGANLPLLGRIVAVAVACAEHEARGEDARAELERERGGRYDPRVLDALPGPAEPSAAPTLRSGMVLEEDLLTPDGILLATRGQRLSEALLEHIRAIEAASGHPLPVKAR